MSILSKNNCENSTPFFHEFKKQASFFLKEKIKTARLALTDVTPAELLTEEATSGNPWAADTRTLASISRSAFEIDDYMRIVEILHKRLLKFEKKNWRLCYNSLIVLERLLTHGPESVADEFHSDKDVIRQMESFQHIDEKGFNWGLAVRKKSERVLKLLEKGPLLKEERERYRKLTRGIQGFGSFTQRSSSFTSAKGILTENTSLGKYGRSHSQFSSHENQQEGLFIKSEGSNPSKGIDILVSVKRSESLSSEKTETSVEENMAPDEKELHQWDRIGESNDPLLDGKTSTDESGIAEDDHPFGDTDTQSTASLLSAVQ